MSNVIKLEGKYVEKRIRKKGKDDSTHHCIRCDNGKF